MNLRVSHLIPLQAWVLLYQNKSQTTSNELASVSPDTILGLGTAVSEQITDTYGCPTPDTILGLGTAVPE